jgi:hypothetical protein
MTVGRWTAPQPQAARMLFAEKPLGGAPRSPRARAEQLRAAAAARSAGLLRTVTRQCRRRRPRAATVRRGAGAAGAGRRGPRAGAGPEQPKRRAVPATWRTVTRRRRAAPPPPPRHKQQSRRAAAAAAAPAAAAAAAQQQHSSSSSSEVARAADVAAKRSWASAAGAWRYVQGGACWRAWLAGPPRRRAKRAGAEMSQGHR